MIWKETGIFTLQPIATVIYCPHEQAEAVHGNFKKTKSILFKFQEGKVPEKDGRNRIS